MGSDSEPELPLTDINLAKEWLRRLKYKPNWSFYIVDGYSGLEIGITLRVPDSRTDLGIGERMITLTTSVPLPRYVYTFEHFVEEWRRAIKYAENHEMDEWMRVDGELRWDPHEYKIQPRFTGTSGTGTAQTIYGNPT